jgi:hypothetical protein
VVKNRQKKKRPLWVKLLVAVGSIVLLLVVVGLVWDRIAFDRVERAKAELDQAGILYTYADLEAARKSWPEDENAATLLLELTENENWDPPVSEEVEERLPLLGFEESPELGIHWSGATAAAVDAYLADRAEMREQLDRLRQYEGGRFPVDPASSFPDVPLPPLSGLRYAVRVKALDAEWHLLQGETDRFVDDIEVIQKLATLVADDTSFAAMIHGMIIEDLGVRTIERGLSLTELAPGRLEQLDSILRQMHPPERIRWALQGELAYWVAALETFRKGQDPPAVVQTPVRVSLVPGLRGFLAADGAFGIEQYRRLIEVSDNPVAALEVAREIDRWIASRPLYAFMSRSLFPVMTRMFQYDTSSELLVECARVAMATERYRLDHGGFPTALDELVPDYIEAVPVDFFDAKPLKYRIDDDGVVIYSVNWNGVDDGGDLEWRKDGTGQPDSGFRLLKPELRGRPAPVETAETQ